jgi:hypothetical protein
MDIGQEYGWIAEPVSTYLSLLEIEPLMTYRKEINLGEFFK